MDNEDIVKWNPLSARNKVVGWACMIKGAIVTVSASGMWSVLGESSAAQGSVNAADVARELGVTFGLGEAPRAEDIQRVARFRAASAARRLTND